MKKVTITLPDETIWDLKQICFKDQVSQQQLISKAVGDYLRKYKTKNVLPEYPNENK